MASSKRRFSACRHVGPETSQSLMADHGRHYMSLSRFAPLLILSLVLFPLTILGADSTAKGTTVSAASGNAFTDSATGMAFIWVEGGCFRMGSPEMEAGKFDDEVPHHEVCVDGFYIGKYEVTQQEWSKVMEENPSTFRGKTLPVENVTYRDSMNFVAKLNQKSGKNFDLPTEAEWEFASIGGRASKGFTYSGSNNLDEVGWYEGNSDRTTHVVGQKKANELGIHDMNGNVMEWCKDWYYNRYYASSPKDNPKGPSSGKEKVLRGGSWRMPLNRSRVENREFAIVLGYLDDIGLRLVLRK